ncbi:hypothetical protein FD30_GL000986 [Levilactobacillus namurensis DSM 19117]|uniref:Uncharacterized protein n=1 Tax=Levilactobacillus namurensis DSM 19117 TaxID=1423773 RepID=A0A0R1JNC7_9LACO|nr:hypothetical protein [Levilactobacillus namurensis]KRK72862.1 hypothetical protein FD30_GL000986 [Levilactobacillus namurensis DSM 19117]GEO75340.1 hypothetical protein LNA02_20380 [Levilactobacillus namurensis]
MTKELSNQEIEQWTTERLRRRGMNPKNWQLMAVLLDREVYLFRNAHRREQVTVYQRRRGQLDMGNLWGE